MRSIVFVGLSLLCSIGCVESAKKCATETDVKNKREEKKERYMQKATSGLQYEVLQEACENASSPQVGQQVVVHYTGWLADADGKPDVKKKFDSSVDRCKPFVFTVGVGMVIKGWDEGVLMMKVGEKRRFTIPSDLGYGARGVPGVIPGGATLIFDVELLELK